MVCRLNLTERETPKQLNPINMILPLLLRQIIKHIELHQVIINTREDGRLYTISNLLALLKNYICMAVLRGGKWTHNEVKYIFGA